MSDPYPQRRRSAALAWPILASSVPTLQAAEDDESQAKSKAISAAGTMLLAPMRDGVGLATDVYLPKGAEGPFPGSRTRRNR